MAGGRTSSFPVVVALPLLAVLGGCGVERTLRVESEPSGALVYLNGEEAGRTPMRRAFLWYGTYDLQLRKEGYVTKSDEAKVWAPWWQWPPFDLFAELVPARLHDDHVVRYRLNQVTPDQEDPEQVIARALRQKRKLRSSENTRKPTPAATRPATTRASTTQPTQ